jgi:RimJ/RimL family protein N-acetyltransferase
VNEAPACTAVIRPASERDLPALATLLAMPEIATAYFGAVASLDMAYARLQHNQAEAGQGRGEAWVTCAQGQPSDVLAYAAIIGGRLAYFVHPAWRRRGLACAIGAAACSRAFEARPAANIEALAFRDNRASVAVLERLGFRFTGLSWPMVKGRPQPVAMLQFELDGQTWARGGDFRL